MAARFSSKRLLALFDLYLYQGIEEEEKEEKEEKVKEGNNNNDNSIKSNKKENHDKNTEEENNSWYKQAKRLSKINPTLKNSSIHSYFSLLFSEHENISTYTSIITIAKQNEILIKFSNLELDILNQDSGSSTQDPTYDNDNKNDNEKSDKNANKQQNKNVIRNSYKGENNIMKNEKTSIKNNIKNHINNNIKKETNDRRHKKYNRKGITVQQGMTAIYKAFLQTHQDFSLSQGLNISESSSSSSSTTSPTTVSTTLPTTTMPTTSTTTPTPLTSTTTSTTYLSSGSTASVAVLFPSHILIANVGDSRIVMCCGFDYNGDSDGENYSGKNSSRNNGKNSIKTNYNDDSNNNVHIKKYGSNINDHERSNDNNGSKKNKINNTENTQRSLFFQPIQLTVDHTPYVSLFIIFFAFHFFIFISFCKFFNTTYVIHIC